MTNRILLITDDSPLAASLEAQLALWGYGCLTCRDASEALRQAAEEPPLAVVVDTDMPRVDVLDVVTALRQHGPTSRTAAVAILPSLADDVVELAAGRGCDRVTSRPVDPDWIGGEIDRIAARRHEGRSAA